MSTTPDYATADDAERLARDLRGDLDDYRRMVCRARDRLLAAIEEADAAFAADDYDRQIIAERLLAAAERVLSTDLTQPA